MEKTNVIKLKYLRAGQPSGREYTFFYTGTGRSWRPGRHCSGKPGQHQPGSGHSRKRTADRN